MLSSPLNIPKWLEENAHLLKPPVNNYCVYNEDVTVMIVGGPNARTDYHINETAEWFYQYKGSMILKVVDESIPETTPNSRFKDIIIEEGSMFLLPPLTPHNPVRFASTIGIVIEQIRPPTSLDRLRWYCPNTSCRQIVKEASFHCTDLGTQIKTAVEEFRVVGEEGRRCGVCGEVADVVPKEGWVNDPNLA